MKEWVLAAAMDRKVSRQLRKDERDTYEASLIDVQSGTKSLPCVITGKVLVEDTHVYNSNPVEPGKHAV